MNNKSQYYIYINSILSTAGAFVIGIATSVITARFLGPTDRGELASLMYVAATTVSFILITTSPQAIIWAITKNNSKTILASAMSIIKLQTIAAFFTAPALLFMLHDFKEVQLIAATILCMVSAASSTFYNGNCALSRAQNKFYTVNLSVATIPLIYLSGILLIIGTGRASIEAILIANIIPVAIYGFKLFSDQKIRISGITNEMKFILSSGRSFIPVAIVSLLLASIDKALILKFSDLTNFGYYAVAATITSSISVIINSFLLVSYVEISNTKLKNDAMLLATARFRSAQIIMTLLVIFLFLGRDIFIKILFGEKFQEVGIVLAWLAVATGLQGLASILDNNLRSTNNKNLSVLVMCVAILTISTSGYILIPKMGATGAAIACTIGYLSMLICSLIIWKKITRFPWSSFNGFNMEDAFKLYSYFKELFPRKFR
jgi:O-antigen/teichoic acid export membrane protein